MTPDFVVTRVTEDGPAPSMQSSAPAVSSSVRPFSGDAEAGLFGIDPVDDFLAVWCA